MTRTSAGIVFFARRNDSLRCNGRLLLARPGTLGATRQSTSDHGDRLTGKITKLDGGKLILNTSYAGDIKIDLGRIRSLQTDDMVTVVLGNDQRLYGKIAGDGAEITVQPTGQGTATQEPTGKI